MGKLRKAKKIILPAKIRKKMNINEGDSILYRVKGKKLIIMKGYRSCYYCDSLINLITVKDISLCTECVKLLSKSAAGSALL